MIEVVVGSIIAASWIYRYRKRIQFGFYKWRYNRHIERSCWMDDCEVCDDLKSKGIQLRRALPRAELMEKRQ